MHRLAAGGGYVVTSRASREWLSPLDLAKEWGVCYRTARKRLLAMDRELHGTLLIRNEDRSDRRVRVSKTKLRRYFELRSATVPSAQVRQLRTHSSRIEELERQIEELAMALRMEREKAAKG